MKQRQNWRMNQTVVSNTSLGFACSKSDEFPSEYEKLPESSGGVIIAIIGPTSTITFASIGCSICAFLHWAGSPDGPA